MPESTVVDGDPVEIARLKPIFDCMAILTTGEMADWWFGILSTRTVVHRSGRLGLAGEGTERLVDPAELALCRSLAAKAEGIGAVGMDSESECDFFRFFAAAAVGEKVPAKIDEKLIRARFGGTILPIAPVRVQPLDEASPWWSNMMRHVRNSHDFEAQRLGLKVDVWTGRALEVARSLSERGLTPEDDLKAEGKEADSGAVRSFLRQLTLIRLLRGPEFRDAAYVEIGDTKSPPPKKWPAGLQRWPSQFPRLFLGLTHGGGLAGVITYVVLT